MELKRTMSSGTPRAIRFMCLRDATGQLEHMKTLLKRVHEVKFVVSKRQTFEAGNALAWHLDMSSRHTYKFARTHSMRFERFAGNRARSG